MALPLTRLLPARPRSLPTDALVGCSADSDLTCAAVVAYGHCLVGLLPVAFVLLCGQAARPEGGDGLLPRQWLWGRLNQALRSALRLDPEGTFVLKIWLFCALLWHVCKLL